MENLLKSDNIDKSSSSKSSKLFIVQLDQLRSLVICIIEVLEDIININEINGEMIYLKNRKTLLNQIHSDLVEYIIPVVIYRN